MIQNKIEDYKPKPLQVMNWSQWLFYKGVIPQIIQPFNRSSGENCQWVPEGKPVHLFVKSDESGMTQIRHTHRCILTSLCILLILVHPHMKQRWTLLQKQPSDLLPHCKRTNAVSSPELFNQTSHPHISACLSASWKKQQWKETSRKIWEKHEIWNPT